MNMEAEMTRFASLFCLLAACQSGALYVGSKCVALACAIDCPHGVQKDAEGCATCTCDNTSTCPPLNCTVSCPRGLQKDGNGCATCTCAPGTAMDGGGGSNGNDGSNGSSNGGGGGDGKKCMAAGGTCGGWDNCTGYLSETVNDCGAVEPGPLHCCLPCKADTDCPLIASCDSVKCSSGTCIHAGYCIASGTTCDGHIGTGSCPGQPGQECCLPGAACDPQTITDFIAANKSCVRDQDCKPLCELGATCDSRAVNQAGATQFSSLFSGCLFQECQRGCSPATCVSSRCSP